MKLDRRWWVAIGVVAVAAVALVVSRIVLDQPSEECRPVQDLLDFNHSQAALIESKSGDSDGIPSVADETAYRAWADGLAERAQKITAPELKWTGSQLAELANEFVGKLATVRGDEGSRAPGAPTPPVVYEMAALNTQISQKLAELSNACSR